MEFWFALADVYRVLLATIEHPFPLSGMPQDSVWFLLNWWQASFIYTLQLFQATTFDPTICKAIAQSIWSLGFELHPTLNYANNQWRTTLLFKLGINAWVRVLKWLQCSKSGRSASAVRWPLSAKRGIWNRREVCPICIEIRLYFLLFTTQSTPSNPMRFNLMQVMERGYRQARKRRF